MRILMATMGMDIGGAETHILELSKELKRRGNNVFVVSNGGKYTEELEEFGIEHIWAPLNDKRINNLRKSYVILEKVIKEKNIELVHSHSRISSFICEKLHRKYRFPFVTTAHWTFKVTPLLKKVTSWGENVVAVSEDIKDYLIKNYNVPADNIFVTVNGIDTEKFSRNVDYTKIKKEFDLKENANRIVYVSRLDESRALVAKQLVNIAKKLNDKIENLEIVIVGGGDVFEKIKEKADSINEMLNKKLIVMSGARTDINLFVACGTIFIGVSRAALEAMACEQPVIVAGNEGYLGIFDESKLQKGIETNFCCRGLEQSSEELLEEDILKLMAKTNKEEYGKYNRDIVMKYYSVSRMTDDCEKAYTKTLLQYS